MATILDFRYKNIHFVEDHPRNIQEKAFIPFPILAIFNIPSTQNHTLYYEPHKNQSYHVKFQITLQFMNIGSQRSANQIA